MFWMCTTLPEYFIFQLLYKKRCVCACSSTDAVSAFCLRYKELTTRCFHMSLTHLQRTDHFCLFDQNENWDATTDDLCDERTVSFTLQVVLLTLKMLHMWPLILMLFAPFHHSLLLQPLDGIQALYRLKLMHTCLFKLLTVSLLVCLIWILCFNLSKIAKDSVYLPFIDWHRLNLKSCWMHIYLNHIHLFKETTYSGNII